MLPEGAGYPSPEDRRTAPQKQSPLELWVRKGGDSGPQVKTVSRGTPLPAVRTATFVVQARTRGCLQKLPESLGVFTITGLSFYVRAAFMPLNLPSLIKQKPTSSHFDSVLIGGITNDNDLSSLGDPAPAWRKTSLYPGPPAVPVV